VFEITLFISLKQTFFIPIRVLERLIMFRTFILIILLSSSLYAEEFLSDTKLKEVEDKILSKMDAKKIGAEREFYLNLLMARELYTYEKFSFAKKYFQKVRSSTFQADKTEALVGLAQISFQDNDKTQLKKDLKNLEAFYKENPKYSTGRNQDLIKYYKFIGLKQKEIGENEFKNLKNKILEFNITEEKRRNFIIEKKYREAFQLIDKMGIETLNVGYKIEHDLLNVLVNKKKVKAEKLHCYDKMKKYPKDWSYSILICTSLTEYLNKGRISSKNLHNLERYFTKRATNRKHLLSALKGLE
jgi:hypothetical protein